MSKINNEEEGTIRCLRENTLKIVKKNFIKEQLNNPGLGLRGAFGPVQFNDEYDDINVYRER